MRHAGSEMERSYAPDAIKIGFTPVHLRSKTEPSGK